MSKNSFIKLIFACGLFLSVQQVGWAQKNFGKLVLKFNYKANGRALVLGDANYVNAFSEHYSITRLKYYISNVNLWGNDVFLVDASKEDSIPVQAFAGVYSKLVFTMGVDSILNCSGAQDGALDPLNGMFWTWNSGYVFFKMEGYSSSSNADLHRIEHHIGGYQGINKAARKIELFFQEPMVINEDDVKTVHLQMDLDKYWQGKNDITIASNALIMIPGELAKKSADNFAGMFSIISIK